MTRQPESFGAALARWRKAQRPRLSLRGLGVLAHYSHVYIWQLERGEKPVTPALAARLDEVLGAGGELVAIAEDAEAAWLADSAAVRVAAEEPVEVAAVEALEAAHLRFTGMFAERGGLLLRPRVAEYIRTDARPLPQRRYGPELVPRLHVAFGRLLALSGICAYDCDDAAAAGTHYDSAVRSGWTAGDRRFVGYVTALMAHLAWRTGGLEEALTACSRVLDGTAAPPSAVAADLLAVRAAALAARGDTADAGRQLTAAFDCLQRVEESGRADEPDWTGHITRGRLESMRAIVLRACGDLELAEAAARMALVLDRSTPARTRLARLIVLAEVLLDRGDTNGATKTLADAAELGAHVDSPVLHSRHHALCTATGNEATQGRDASPTCPLWPQCQDARVGVNAPRRGTTAEIERGATS